MKASPATSNQRLLDRLMADGRLSADGHATIVSFVGLHGGRVEDALIENQVLTEADLLRYVSTAHGTRFVSSEKLYKAVIDPKLLKLIPRKLAEQHMVFPVMYDDAKRAISVVTPDPDNLAALHEVKIASGMREVVALVARPATVRAAIARAYHGDASAFATLMRGGGDGLVLSLDRFQTGQGSIAFSNDVVRARGAIESEPELPPGLQAASRNSLQRAVPTPEPARAPPPRAASWDRTSEPSVVPDLQPAPAPALAPAPARQPPPPPPTARARARSLPDDPQVQVTLTADYAETLNVLVSLLESSRPELRGHSAQCARLLRKVCERMGLSVAQTAAYVVGSHFHDLGKAGTYHLTSLNVAEYDGHRAAAQKVYNVPERFLEAVHLHADTKSTINAMYERFDGKGFPLGVSGKDIPLGARILAVVDSYTDVTTNPKNPARRVLKPHEAMQFFAKYRGTVFDPTVLDLVKAEVAGEDLRAKLLSDRHTVLIVDADPEDSTVLELRLIEAGFDVRNARTYQQAVHELNTREIAVVVSEVDLDAEDAGITLRTSANAEPWGQKVMAWIIHTRKTDRQLAEIVFELGVDDLVSKPTPPEVFVTKLRQLLERKQASKSAASAPRGVSGSLAEMGLPDVVQILWHGRKTCTVRLKTKVGSGDIGFVDGQIVDAHYGGKRGEEAFYALLFIKEGDFKIDTEAQPPDRTINASPEGLLLEGMRRLDEGL